MDTIADMLCAIYNAQVVGKTAIVVPFSRIKFEIAEILKDRGYIIAAEKKLRKIQRSNKPKPCLEITLKYTNRIPAISGFKRISKPGQRIYKASSDLRQVKQGQGIAILSTSKGLMTNNLAKKQKIGGEVLCEIW